MHSLNIGIAGCGTAGLAAAALLARDGHRVVLFERFDMPQPVGSGLMLQPTGMAVMAALGLRETMIGRGARVERLHGLAHGRTVLDVRYASLKREDGFGLGVHRTDLFDALFGAAVDQGIDIATGRTVCGCDQRRFLFGDGSSSPPFDLLVDAMGSRSVLVTQRVEPLAYGALWSTVSGLDGLVPQDTLSQRYHLARHMAGLLPLGCDAKGESRTAIFWSLRTDLLDATMQAGIGAWRDAWHRLWPETAAFAAAVPSLETMNFARYAHRTLKRPIAGRLIHLGDSWHSTSPQLGQGANQALLDAYALSAALRSHDDVDEALKTTVTMRQGHIRIYQAMSRLLTPIYQSDGYVMPMLRDWLVGPLSNVWPVPQLQARMVSGLIGSSMSIFTSSATLPFRHDPV